MFRHTSTTLGDGLATPNHKSNFYVLRVTDSINYRWRSARGARQPELGMSRALHGLDRTGYLI